MYKKWGYACALISILCSLGTVVSIYLSTALVSSILGTITLVMCCATAAVFHTIVFPGSITRRPLTRAADHAAGGLQHMEPISHAVDPSQMSDEDEKANAESATSTTPDVLASPHRDEESGLLSNSFFPVYLEQRITAARRTLRPVSLVIFELDGLDKNDSNSPTDRNFYISAVGDVVKRTLRESDCAFRIEGNIFAAVMDDTTESGAVWAAERVRGVLHTGALAGRVTVSAGVACYPSHALESEILIDSANKALAGAKARGVDQVEIAAEQ